MISLAVLVLSGCASTHFKATGQLPRKACDRESVELMPEEVPGLAATKDSAFSYVLYITARELGPIVKLFSSLALVEGGTEVVLEIRAVTASTEQTTANFTAH